jgi:CopA family copper-resistance protein
MSMDGSWPARPGVSRRRFVTGSGLVLASSQLPSSASAFAHPGVPVGTAALPVPELRGTQFNLSIGALPVNITGRPAQAVAINGSMPGPTLYWRQGDEVTLKVSNRLGVDTSLHWHGIVLPAAMDGVPGLSFHGISASESYIYRFKLNQSGTYWYHAHSSLQEAKGAFGAIVVAPAGPDPVAVDRDYVLLLSDWSDEDPHAIVRKLKLQPDYYNVHKRTVGDFARDVRRQGFGAAAQDRRIWGQMRMSPTDLADVTGLTYTYLVNGASPDMDWSGVFKRGERVRLRFINGSAMTFFDVRIPGLKMTVVAADGQPVHPVSVDEFRIAVAETLDVVVQPQEDQPYTVFCQAMDRSGYARATLTPRPGLQAPVPSLDLRPLLTMADMGMDHGPGDISAMTSIAPAAGTQAPVDHTAMGHMRMDHAAMAQTDPAGMPGPAHGMIQHPASETGNPAVDMQAMAPSRALDDPGIGLRGNGRRVLTAADLHSTFEDPDPREPGRELQLHLTGNMERYVWGFDGIPFSKAAPIRLNYGERMRIVLVNDTMMEHPIHLHGMWSDLENADGQFQVRRHTVSVPPGSVRSYRVSADALGRWAFHCHMLLHMELGMFREVHVA